MSTKKIIALSCAGVALVVAVVLIITIVIPKITKPVEPDIDKPKEESLIATVLSNVKTSKDYKDIYKIIDDLSNSSSPILRAFTDDIMIEESASAEMAPGSDAGGNADGSAPLDSSKAMGDAGLGSAGGSEFSETNIQVEGVDEADVIKTDGEYIYAINTEALYIVKANKGEPELTAKIANISKGGQFYTEMYLQGDRIIAIKNNVYGLQPYGYEQSDLITFIDIFDVSDKAKPSLVESISQSGFYKHSRMIDDILYLVTDYTIYNGTAKEDIITSFVPCYTVGENQSTAKPEDISILPEPSMANYTLVSGIKTSGTVDFVSQKSILGESYELYASNNTIYLSSVKYKEEVSRDTKVEVVHYHEDTLLTKVAIDKGEVEVKTSVTIPGRILNQFSLDEYKGVLRVVTTINNNTYYYNRNGAGGIIDEMMMGIASSSQSKQHNAVMTLDENLKVIGSIEDIAPDEQVYSCRFMEDIAYFVTFRQVDPLFSVDLSDPASPKIIGALKIPGFSDYLHPYDTGLLFGLGRNADDSGRTDFLKLSMFDNSDPTNVTEKDKLIIDGEYFSEASYNHKAIIVDARKNLVAFPAENKYLIYTYDKKTGFKQEAEIKLAEQGFITTEYIRGMFIDNIFFVISANSVNAYDMDKDFAKLGTVQLPKEPVELQPMPLPTPRDGIVDIIE